MDFLKKSFLPLDPIRIEVTARIGLSCFLSLILSIADIPSVLPASLSFFPAIVAVSLSLSIPFLLFSVGTVIPITFMLVIFTQITQTALLAAATISDGLFVGLFAVMAFIISGLYFGEKKQQVSSMGAAFTCLTGMNALSYRTLVQDGFSASVSNGQVAELLEWVQGALTTVCELNGQPLNCWEEELPRVDGSLEITLPDSAGDLAGQTAFISVSGNSTLTVNVPGGLWIVSGLWTWSGVDNPLAGNRNMLIALGWGMAALAFGIVLPPFRTARKIIARTLVPAVLSEIAAADNLEAATEKKDKLVHFYNTIVGGSIADVTTFEPRIFTAPYEYIVPQLKALVVATEKAMLGAFVEMAWNRDDVSIEKGTKMKASFSILGECAKALASNEDENLKKIKAEHKELVTSSVLDVPSYFSTLSDNVLDATLAWLDVYKHPQQPHPCSKAGNKNLLKIYLPWILLPMLYIEQLAVVLMRFFHPKKWNWRDILFSFKVTLGFVALFVSTVYWDKYSDYAIETNQGTSGAVFSGWQLLAYAYSWKPTVEGSVKKGIQRGFGTALGGFMAWLGIIVCSWSYDDDAEINRYGLCAWLTVSCVIAGYFSIDPGMAARVGFSPDHGYVGLYFAMTEVLIALEVFRGAGSKNALTVNRVVANLAGIALALILSLIPPFVRGGDPKLEAECLSSLKGDFADLLQTLLNEEDHRKIVSEDYKTAFLQDASSKLKTTAFYLKDANKLKVLPFMKVDERLKPLLEDMVVSKSLIGLLLAVAGNIVEANKTAEIARGTAAHHVLQQILSRYKDDATEKEEPTGELESGAQPDAVNADANAVTSLLVSLVRTIDTTFLNLEAELSQIG
jgi:hypothetical protein